MLLTDPPCGHKRCAETPPHRHRCAQTWPTVVVVGTAPSSAQFPAKGAVALDIANSRYHLTAEAGRQLLADLRAALDVNPALSYHREDPTP